MDCCFWESHVTHLPHCPLVFGLINSIDSMDDPVDSSLYSLFTSRLLTQTCPSVDTRSPIHVDVYWMCACSLWMSFQGIGNGVVAGCPPCASSIRLTTHQTTCSISKLIEIEDLTTDRRCYVERCQISRFTVTCSICQLNEKQTRIFQTGHIFLAFCFISRNFKWWQDHFKTDREQWVIEVEIGGNRHTVR